MLNADLHKCLHVTYRAERWSSEAIRVDPHEKCVCTIRERPHGTVRRDSQASSEEAACS
jgi:hypothetical protein